MSGRVARVGMDASRNRSGGAIAHVTGILQEADPRDFGIDEVHLWSHRGLLDQVPPRPWLVKHSPPELEGSLGTQVLWQWRSLPRAASRAGCSVLFATDAATVCPFRPLVVMSQDMLSYEAGVMQFYRLGRARLRLLAILHIQNRAMRRADGVIFLSRYAAGVLQGVAGTLRRTVVIPHGVDEAFRKGSRRPWPGVGVRPIQCLYVSNVAPYKHQWNVVRAVRLLREGGHAMRLVLAGDGGRGPAWRSLEAEVEASDSGREFVERLGAVEHKRVPELMAAADIFIFASSCENLPVTLLEAMASGLPIACSDRGPMPEVLEDGGVCFDPESPESIAAAVERIIKDRGLRESIAMRAREISERYSWSRCAKETWQFLAETCGKRQL